MKLFYIHNEESIRSFLKEMYNLYQQPFDPSDDLRTLPGENDSPFFAKHGGEYLDNVMTQCFIYCILNDLNIYRIANEVQMEIFKNKAVA
ncbi:MAG: hypothetical protein JWN83_1244 [Chitinophagaceae bacterium]|nr:hypothetical protein [Chitinophagaceae bacterium]